MVAQSRFRLVLPDELVDGEPFYCLMETTSTGEITGTYITSVFQSEESVLVLFFSKKEAEEFKTIPNSVVRGIDKRHLSILFDYSDNFGLNLAIKQFTSVQGIGVQSGIIRDYLL